MPEGSQAVFLSYRREETRHLAGRLADRLTQRLGSTQVFMDVDTIEPGADVVGAIARAVTSCDVLIALMGPSWSTVVDQRGQRRLEDPEDFVVLEIQAALEREISVIPVLVDGAAMPGRSDLPEALQGLTRRNAIRLDHETFRSDITALLNAVERILSYPAQKAAELQEKARGRGVDQTIDEEHPAQAPKVNNFKPQRKGGKDAGAGEAGQRAIDSGHAGYGPLAAVNLGSLRTEQGDVAGARAAYQQAIKSDHSEFAPRAAVNLGVLLAEQGDVAGARVAYQQAIDSGHADRAPLAAVCLGLLLAQQEDLAGARAAYQQAIDSGHAGYGPLAGVYLGLLLAQQGDLAGAQAAAQGVLDSDHPHQAPALMFNIGLLLAELGDVAGARAAYQQAIDSGHAEWARLAENNLEQQNVADGRTRTFRAS